MSDSMIRRTGFTSRRAGWQAGLFFTFCVFIGVAAPGCTEFAHFGQVSDREGSFPVNGVSIWQQENDGSWREIGSTDGKGKWNILKSRIKGGGRIKMQKAGYQTLIMGESDFLQQNSILIQATDSGNFGSDGAAWNQ